MDHHFDGLVQNCSISSVLAMETPQSCTKPTICTEDLWLRVSTLLSYHCGDGSETSPILECTGVYLALPLWVKQSINTDALVFVRQDYQLTFYLTASSGLSSEKFAWFIVNESYVINTNLEIINYFNT